MENCNYILTSNGELYHYGVKGMKWGKRKAAEYESKARNARASAREWDQISRYQTDKVRSKYQKKYAKDGDKEWLEIGEAKAQRKEAKYKKYADADRADAAKLAARAKAHNQQVAKTTSAIKDYRNKFNDAEKSSNAADAKWAAAKEQYKSLGKTRVTRMLNAARGKSDAAKKYSKMYDEAERASNIADQKWSAVKESYKKTGRNRIERILNQVEYDRKRK